MRIAVRIMILCLALAGSCGIGAEAAVPGIPRAAVVPAERVAFKDTVMGPFAYTHFCMRYADDCRIHGFSFRRPKPVAMTKARWRDLMEINRSTNAAIAPKRYVNDTSFDTWRVAPRTGDCNDYAVTKRHELLARGWPSRALLLAEVVTPWGEHHLVLLVRTEERDFVLDNLNANIRIWSKTGYRWCRVQSPTVPELWATIKDGRVPSS